MVQASVCAPPKATEIVEVSPEMTAIFGERPPCAAPVPPDPISIVVAFAGPDGAPTLHIDPAPEIEAIAREGEGDYRMLFLVCRSAVLRLGGEPLAKSLHRDFHLPPELRAIAMALRDPPAPPEARSTYRLAKSIELFCETIRLFGQGGLLPLARHGALSAADTSRILSARRLIEERWNEKLTLDRIARACGLNRTKLTRGFRELFDCSVAEAIAEQRLLRASRLLLTTDLPVASIGYEAGYQNNASFARAFGRHFGRTPSDFRACGAAA